MKANQFVTPHLENANYVIQKRVEKDAFQLNHAKNNANLAHQLNKITYAIGKKCHQHAIFQMLDHTLKKNVMTRA
jgi:hypothetical protein